MNFIFFSFLVDIEQLYFSIFLFFVNFLWIFGPTLYPNILHSGFSNCDIDTVS